MPRHDAAALVDLDEGLRRDRLHDAEPKQRQRGSERDHKGHEETAALSTNLETDPVRGAKHQRLEQGHRDGDGDGKDADAEEERQSPEVHARGGREHLTPSPSTGEP